jgi:hypothetical protein
MENIMIENSPPKEKLEEMGVFSWPIWEKEVSKFKWYYDKKETCFLLEGRVVVEPDEGDPVEFGAGDLVIFPQGLSCTWDIKEDVKKHYNFG